MPARQSDAHGRGPGEPTQHEAPASITGCSAISQTGPDARQFGALKRARYALNEKTAPRRGFADTLEPAFRPVVGEHINADGVQVTSHFLGTGLTALDDLHTFRQATDSALEARKGVPAGQMKKELQRTFGRHKTTSRVSPRSRSL